jgi:hypothetical protein
MMPLLHWWVNIFRGLLAGTIAFPKVLVTAEELSSSFSSW